MKYAIAVNMITICMALSIISYQKISAYNKIESVKEDCKVLVEQYKSKMLSCGEIYNLISEKNKVIHNELGNFTSKNLNEKGDDKYDYERINELFKK